ncbi:hypothetical protein NKR23_g10200 [Pleurostoma richardsiae]|uniref:Uncharacterized protein n=1 Tax=Pleurostoma richardsiae TaxID=41990 RepID=A0AA38R5L1_9PEZI|nr:hypothetical protein NKR23_g10200 [Pleurostoma richardsiae]
MEPKSSLLTVMTFILTFSGGRAAPHEPLDIRAPADICCKKGSDCIPSASHPYTCCRPDRDRCQDGSPFSAIGYCIISNRPLSNCAN